VKTLQPKFHQKKQGVNDGQRLKQYTMLPHCYILQKYRNDLESIFVHSLADLQIQILNGDEIYLPFCSWRNFSMKKN
jgi:hypothetical protein